jgi:carbonic anhydrase/acetyltransferase-like protein (isoleucine patch superfamily)
MSKENIIEYKKKNPVLGKDVFIASGVKIIGDVIISDNSSVWYNCVIRADVNFVRIGKCTNIQDGTVIHVSSQGFSATGSKGAPTIIENNVTIGHNATIHACSIKNNALIGMGAVILDGAEIKEMSLVAAGAIITPGTIVGERELWAGNPAKFIRKISVTEEKLLINTPKVYENLSKEFLKK